MHVCVLSRSLARSLVKIGLHQHRRRRRRRSRRSCRRMRIIVDGRIQNAGVREEEEKEEEEEEEEEESAYEALTMM